MNACQQHITKKTALALVLALGLAGCAAAGPDFHAPVQPKQAGYGPVAGKTAYAAGTVAGAAQAFAQGGDVPSAWWTLYRSPALDNLMRRALAASPTVAAARANVAAAEEAALAARGGYLPTAGVVGNATREKISGSSRGSSGQTYAPFTLYNASVEISYSPDLFGGIRRAVEAATATAAQQRALMRATYITLEGNIVTAAVQDAALNGEIDATRMIVAIDRQQLEILKKQLALGGVASSAVLAQETALAQVEATLPELEKQLAATENQLKALSGNFPGAGAAHFDLGDLYLPRKLPVSLPSRLVRQRPDILAAEAQMHAASANIGIAAANMLPQVTLTGSYGLDANALEGFFSPSHIIWNAGAGLVQPFLPDPTLRHKKEEARAQYRAAAAQYRATVIAAFQNVSDALNALQFDAETLKASATAARSAIASLRLAQHRFNAGAVSYLALLDAENAYQQTRINLVKAEAARYADTAALFVALGGGWWNQHKDGKK